MFADRPLLTDPSFAETGSNTNATREPGEPKHAGKVGGHSLWVSWQAPDDGVVTVSTAGSSFDTLLAVYQFDDEGDDAAIDELETVAYNDDYGGLSTSSLQFGANAGQVYQIAVDGFNGATGDVLLQLTSLTSSNLQPTMVGISGDQSLQLGAPLILTANIVPVPHMELEWYLNGSPVPDDNNTVSSPTLVIPSLQRTDLGFYSLKFTLDDDSFFSPAIEIQINTEGQNKVLARNKIADAAQSGLGNGVMLGYNGTQIFNTSSAIVDPSAPTICGVPPGAAYWFSYQAPAAGLMTLNTSGSSFATLLAAFTYKGALTSYANLTLVACDNNINGTGSGTSSINFETTAGGSYFIVVGGVNGATGIAHLNYLLNPGVGPVLPLVTTQPRSLIVVTQTAVSLSIVAGGSGPFGYQWWKDNSFMKRQTNSSLFLKAPQASDAGNYSVVVTNYSGAVTSSLATVTVVSNAFTRFDPVSGNMIAAFPGVRGYRYSVDVINDDFANGWTFWTNQIPDFGGILWLTNSTKNYAMQIQRVHTP